MTQHRFMAETACTVCGSSHIHTEYALPQSLETNLENIVLFQSMMKTLYLECSVGLYSAMLRRKCNYNMIYTEEFNCLNIHFKYLLVSSLTSTCSNRSEGYSAHFMTHLPHCAKISIFLGQPKCYYLPISTPKLIPCYDSVAN